MKSFMKWSIVIVIVLVGVVLACGFGMIRRGFSTPDKPLAVEAFLAETVDSDRGFEFKNPACRFSSDGHRSDELTGYGYFL
jgi:hypothetical protein